MRLRRTFHNWDRAKSLQRTKSLWRICHVCVRTHSVYRITAKTANTAYEFLHHVRLTWPCLSFDVLRDVRTRRSCQKLHTKALMLYFVTESRRTAYEGTSQRMHRRRYSSGCFWRTINVKRGSSDAIRRHAENQETSQ